MDAEIGSDPARYGPGAARPAAPGSAGAAATAGFTLIELLVAVSVLAVLAVGAALVAGRGNEAPDDDATAFAAAWQTAASLAIAGQAPRGLEIRPTGFAPVRFGPEDWERPGTLRRWQGRASFVPRDPGRPGQPDIVFLSNGQSTAFALELRGRAGSGAGTRCTSDGWTGLRCD